jgi:hypothetical protein
MLRKYSPEEAAQAIAASRATLSRPLLNSQRENSGERREHPQHADAPVDLVDLSPIEKLSERHRRELDERDAQWERERRQRQREQEREQRERWNAQCRAEAESRIGELESQLCEAIKGTIGAIEALEHELNFVTSENRELKTKLAEIEIKVAELKLEARGGKVIEHPIRAVN